MDLRIETDQTIFGAAQISEVPSVSLMPETEIRDIRVSGLDSKGNKIAFPAGDDLIVFTHSYRILIPRMSSKTELAIVFRLVALNPPPNFFWGPRTMPQSLLFTGKYKANGFVWTIGREPNRGPIVIGP